MSCLHDVMQPIFLKTFMTSILICMSIFQTVVFQKKNCLIEPWDCKIIKTDVQFNTNISHRLYKLSRYDWVPSTLTGIQTLEYLHFI